MNKRQHRQQGWQGNYDCDEKWKEEENEGHHEKLVEGLVDEDERDEDGEYFLRKAGDVSDQEAAFHSHDDDYYHYEPHPHPGTAHNVFNALGLAELVWNEQRKIVENLLLMKK